MHQQMLFIVLLMTDETDINIVWKHYGELKLSVNANRILSFVHLVPVGLFLVFCKNVFKTSLGKPENRFLILLAFLSDKILYFLILLWWI